MKNTDLEDNSSPIEWSVTIFFLFFFLAGCSENQEKASLQTVSQFQESTAQVNVLTGRKVLYVDSYHAEYPPSKVSYRTAREILESAGVEVRVIYMDAKKEKSDSMLKQAALRVKDFIASWQPDLVIAADDPASMYLVLPYYKDAALPFVFTGVNWNADKYGYPYTNVTGQVEVELVADMLAELKKYGRGNRVGILTGDTLTDKKNILLYQEIMGIQFYRTVLVNDFKEWKAAYLALQNEVDLLFMRNNAGIAEWEDSEAKSFILSRTMIPSGTCTNHMHPFVLINFAKSFSEIGRYSAQTSLSILTGKSLGEIPMSSNRDVKIYLNMPLAKELDILFPTELVDRAIFSD